MTLLSLPRYILAFVRGLLAFTSILLFLIVYTITIPIFGNSDTRKFKLRRAWLKFGIPLFGMRIEHRGTPIGVPALYVCNHRSLSDPMATCLYLDAYVIAKAEVGNIPILSKGAELTGIIYVKRENKDSRNAVREKTIETIQSGKNVLVYPEGTVSGNEKILPYRFGTFIEAAKHGIPIVPIAIEYRRKKNIWIKIGLIAHFFKQFSYWRTDMLHVIGKPITGVSGEEAAKIAEEWTLSVMKDYLEK